MSFSCKTVRLTIERSTTCCIEKLRSIVAPRSWTTGLLAVIAVSLAATGTLLATSIPPGSYQGTCADISVETLLGGSGRNLVAQCQNRRGTYVGTFLALPCKGDIQNKRGSLVCVKGPNPFAPPAGSYTRRCKGVQMSGPILSARCEAAIQTRITTSINTLNCKGRDIRVQLDGKLIC